MPPQVRDCFLLDPAGGSNHHLWIVIHYERNWPQLAQHRYVLVSVSSHPSDKACTLTSADHPYLVHDSYIRYEHTMDSDGVTIERHLMLHPHLAKARISEDVLKKIRQGLHASALTKSKYQAIVPK